MNERKRKKQLEKKLRRNKSLIAFLSPKRKTTFFLKKEIVENVPVSNLKKIEALKKENLKIIAELKSHNT